MHIHSDKEIKTCKICQANILDIQKKGQELNRLGVWNIPKKIKDGVEYTIWRRSDNKKKATL